jgi:hypothetical protein
MLLVALLAAGGCSCDEEGPDALCVLYIHTACWLITCIWACTTY